MPLILLLLIFLIVFPFAVDMYLFFSWVTDSPLPALLYLILTMIAGGYCLRLAKKGFSGGLPQLHNIQNDARIFSILGKLWVAGILLIFPGYISDIVAVTVLLFLRGAKKSKGRAAGKDYKYTETVEIRGQVTDDE